MSWRFSLAVAAFLASACVASVVCGLLWRRRQSPGAKPLMLAMAGAGWWALTAGLELAPPSLPAKVLLSKLSYAGALSVPVLFLLFAIRYTRPDWKLGRRALAALWAVPAASLFLAATNELHGLIWSRIALDPSRNLALYGHGPAFYVMIAYLQGVSLVAVGLLLAAALRSPRAYRHQALALLLGVPLPVLANAAYVLGISPVPGLDLAPVAFIVTGLTLSLGLYRFRLFDLVPYARGAVLDRIADGVLVVDPEGRVLEANPAAARLLGSGDAIEIGGPAGPPVGDWLEPLGASRAPGRFDSFVEATSRQLEVRADPLHRPDGRFGGWLLLVQDVTESRNARTELLRAREDLARRVAELEEALRQIRTLRGLVPICGHCKRIRNDQNYWQQLESFISEHTDAQFSHGICPECYEREMRGLRASGRAKPGSSAPRGRP